MFCKNCGKQISNDSRFCRYCGTLVEELEDVNIENNVKTTVQNQVVEPVKEEPKFEVPDFTASATEEKHEFTLEEIMKEYGHEF